MNTCVARHFSDECLFFPLQIPSTVGAIVVCINKFTVLALVGLNVLTPTGDLYNNIPICPFRTGKYPCKVGNGILRFGGDVN